MNKLYKEQIPMSLSDHKTFRQPPDKGCPTQNQTLPPWVKLTQVTTRCCIDVVTTLYISYFNVVK